MAYLIDIITKENENDGYLPHSILKVTVPYRLGKSLPTKCRCGFFLKTNYKLTDLYCPNPYCFEANAYKIAKILEKADLTLDMGVKTAERILMHNGFSRHMDIFTISRLDQFPESASHAVREKWLDGLNELKRDITVSEFIEYFQIDNIGGAKCSFLFSDMSSIEELEEALYKSSNFRLHISKVLGYASATADSTWRVYETLLRYLPLFKHYAQNFTFKIQEGKTIFISLTGNFQEFRPRTRFLGWLQENYKINPVLVKYSNKSDVLVYEEQIHSTQFENAKRDGKAIKISDFLRKIEHLRR